MDLGLKNKVALVTGGSKGIGKAIAVGLAREGCAVAICARGGNELSQTAAEIKTSGGIALAISADVTIVNDATRLVAETTRQFGTIHILVNNAGGVSKFAPFEEITDEDWTHTLNLNLLSCVRVTRAVLPYMQKQKWGRIINISSESGVQPDPLMPDYNASKAAMNCLTKSLSKAYGKDGILINTVSPAFIRTPLAVEFLGKQAAAKEISLEEAEKQFLQGFRPNIVVGRAGQSEEVAAVTVFLASEAASFITGSNYRVDGGSVASL
jgi:3-oxoacyl-[acyl-carrier protein] reductase